MGTKKRGLRAILREIEHGPERSTLFWYMLEHHDDLARAAAGGRIRWAPLCKRFAELGLLDGEGKPPGPENARVTWWNVRREVARRKAAAQPKPQPYPSRLPADWRPQVAPLVPTRPPDKPPDRPPDDAGDLSGAEANLASLRRFIKSRSG